MTGNGRNGPRARQTMSGILGERRDVGGPPVSAEADTVAAPPENAPPASVIIDQHLSLWARMLNAAERAFDEDTPPSAGSAPEGGRDRNGR
jgi:hypothetical protein